MPAGTKLLENLRKDKEQKSQKKNQYNRVQRLVMKDVGRYVVRILPNKLDPDGVPYEQVFLHFGFNHPNYNTPSTFRCLGKGCPLCVKAREMKEDDKPNAWKFKSTPVFLYYVMDANGNFKFIRLSNTAHNEVYDALSAKAAGEVNPLAVVNGREAVISLSKTDGNKNKWKCSFENESHNVPEEIQQSLKAASALSEIYRRYTEEELTRIATGKKLDFNNSNNNQETVTQDDEQPEDSAPTSAMKSIADEEESSSEEEISMEERRARIKERLKKRVDGGSSGE